ncbi:dTDP-4-dehydrorhamnose reductase [Vibrio sp. WJH972]
MKVMVIGCYGQVGRCLTDQLSIRDDIELLATGRENLDITDKEAVFYKVSSFVPDIIINAAAHTGVDIAELEKPHCYAVNCEGPRYLAQAAQQHDATLLHISSDYVFAGDKNGPYKECDVPAPQGVYGRSKFAGEQAVSEACDKHIILRTAWVFGERGSNFVKTMIRLARSEESIGIVGDQFGGPTYAGDVAAALIKIADTIYSQGESFSGFGLYHFSGAPNLSWSEFAQEIFIKAFEFDLIDKIPEVISLTSDEYPTFTKRPANSMFDTTKITQTFSIPASNWRDALNNIEAYSK